MKAEMGDRPCNIAPIALDKSIIETKPASRSEAQICALLFVMVLELRKRGLKERFPTIVGLPTKTVLELGKKSYVVIFCEFFKKTFNPRRSLASFARTSHMC